MKTVLDLQEERDKVFLEMSENDSKITDAEVELDKHTTEGNVLDTLVHLHNGRGTEIMRKKNELEVKRSELYSKLCDIDNQEAEINAKEGN